MTLSCKQQLRRDLVLKALEVFRDAEAAMNATVALERFVLAGDQDHAKDRSAEAYPALNGAGCHEGVNGHGSAASPEVGRRRRWTDADDALLGRLWREGFTANAISRRLNRSEASVATRASVLKLKRSADRPLIHVGEDQADSVSSMAPRASTVVRLDVEGPIAAAPCTAPEAGDKAPSKSSSDKARKPEVAMRGDQVPEGAIDTVIRFLRSRDYSVVRTDEGLFRLDEREDLTTQELLSRANRVRAYLQQPPFPALAS